MQWDSAASFLLFAVVIQVLFIPITCIYYVKLVQINKDRLFWKIRRPKYFLFYILITLLDDITRCTNGLLLHLGLMTPYWYTIASVPLAYFGGITWGSIRLWLLYYDIKIARKSQLFLLSKHLTLSTTESYSYANDDAKDAIKTPYTQQKQYKSVTLKVFAVVITFCIITLLGQTVLGLPAMSKLLLYSCILLLLAFYTFFLFKLCCGRRCGFKCRKGILWLSEPPKRRLENSPFRDDWLLLLELTIIWIVWIIGFFGALFFFPLREQQIYPSIIIMLTMVTRIIITLTMMILPYKVSLRLNKSNAKTITTSVLKNVLSTQSYFYSFLEHLVQELAIENLTVLVEIWQFKYEQEHNLKPLKVLAKIHAEMLEKAKRKDESETRTNSVHSEWFREVAPTIHYEDPCNILQLQVGNSGGTECMVKFLKSLPWHRLPLAPSIASNLSQTDGLDLNNKWKQCAMIYSKYFDESSYDSVNVSYVTKHQLSNDYYELSTKKMSIDNDSDDEFKAKIFAVFDVAIDDIVHNLRDSLTRFVASEEFKLAQ